LARSSSRTECYTLQQRGSNRPTVLCGGTWAHFSCRLIQHQCWGVEGANGAVCVCTGDLFRDHFVTCGYMWLHFSYMWLHEVTCMLHLHSKV
jgi:hypothetical protein